MVRYSVQFIEKTIGGCKVSDFPTTFFALFYKIILVNTENWKKPSILKANNIVVK